MNIMSIEIMSTMSVGTKSGARTGAAAGDAPACAGGLVVPGGAARSARRDSARWPSGSARGPASAGAAGPRVRRGDVRAAALALLAEEPRNGYQLIQEIAERSDGVWQPSPGSMYPALQQLEDEGLIQAETPEGGRKRYALTAEGREYVAAHADEVRAPWDDVASSVGTDAIELRRLIAAGGGRSRAGHPGRHGRAGDAGAADPHRFPAQALRDPRGR